jgi:hypothetical protein
MGGAHFASILTILPEAASSTLELNLAVWAQGNENAWRFLRPTRLLIDPQMSDVQRMGYLAGAYDAWALASLHVQFQADPKGRILKTLDCLTVNSRGDLNVFLRWALTQWYSTEHQDWSGMMVLDGVCRKGQ